MKVTTRHLIRGKGQHRAIPAPARIEVPLDHLLRPRSLFVDVPHGAVAAQAFRACRPCGGEVAVVLHPGGAYCCDRGHITVTGGVS